MSTYIRGPICGVANCPSRLWRIIDGRRTCQYGHVMEGDVEFNNDDDDIASSGVITRRLNLTTNATGNFQSSFNLSQSQNLQNSGRSKKVYGEEAHILFLKSFQYIIKRQIALLIETFSFPPEFDSVVKIIWGLYLKSLSEEGDGHVNEAESTVRGHFKLNALSSIAMLYMASVHMGLPVYASDFIRWLSSVQLPFFNAADMIPEPWKEKLPNYYLGLLEGGKVPHNGQLFTKVSQLCRRINFITQFNCILRYETLVFRLISRTVLPPEFYLYTLKTIERMDQDENFKVFGEYSKNFKRYYLWAELRVLAYFILTVKWVLLCDTNAFPLSWLQALMAAPSGVERSKETKDQHITHLSSTADMKEIFNWDDDQTSEYLEWVENKLLPTQKNDINAKIDNKIALRKLHKIFPMAAQLYRVEHNTACASYIEELQERYNFFQSSAQNNDNSHIPSSLADTNHRTRAILGLERALITRFAPEFGCSVEQLEVTVSYIEDHCEAACRNPQS